MKQAALFLAGILGVASAFGEGEVGSQAFQWVDYSDLAPSPTTYSLSQYQGKVVLLVVFQYNCGGCVANAPRFGRLADTLQSGKPDSKFQAVGAEIRNATYAQIQTYRNSLTNSNTLTLDFPLVKVPYDTGILMSDPTVENLTRWKRYDAPRDVYFVINHEGTITARVAGNRVSAMTNTQYQSLRTALDAALAAAPASLNPGGPSASGFRANRVARGYRFRVDGLVSGSVPLRIVDVQGRVLTSITLTPASPEAVWNGTDAAGRRVPNGLYFLRADMDGRTLNQRLPLLP